jgi:hypothetical protein
MLRGYDTPQLFDEDRKKRLLWISTELVRIQSEIEGQPKKSDHDDPDAN